MNTFELDDSQGMMYLSFYGTHSLKVVKSWFVWYETWHTILISIYYFFEMVRIEKNSHMLEITC